MNEKLIKIIMDRSEGYVPDFEDEDFDLYDSYGGNIDDAYWGGWDHGIASFCQDIKKLIEEEEK